MTGLRLTGRVVQLRRLRFWRFAWSRGRGSGELGRRGENLAAWYLRHHGYTIVARNYRGISRQRAGAGEIDLIALEGAPATLVFVEVKTRAREGMYAAEGAVNRAKRRHLLRAARDYRIRHRHTGPYRFDLVVIYGPDDARPRLQLHRDAFRD
ncbi:MAG: YraN family protein [Terriglobales bacterium]